MVRAWAGISLSAIVGLGSTPVLSRSPVTSLQALIMAPDRYANRAVTVTGRFRGRAAGDASAPLPPPPNRSRWDFLLNENGAAVWVSGIRPAGWDFDLDPRSAADARKGPGWSDRNRLVAGRARSCSTAAVCETVDPASSCAPRGDRSGLFDSRSERPTAAGESLTIPERRGRSRAGDEVGCMLEAMIPRRYRTDRMATRQGWECARTGAAD